MDLLRFQVTNFRSVVDSGWIDVDRVVALIGVNESGKTNLLLPLWKLRPAQEGDIQPTSDYPKKMFGEIREKPESFCFIRAEFSTGTLMPILARLTGEPEDQLQKVIVSRYYDGNYDICFPGCEVVTSISAIEINDILQTSHDDIVLGKALKQEESSKVEILNALQQQINQLVDAPPQNIDSIKQIIKNLQSLMPDDPARSSVIFPLLARTIEAIKEKEQILAKPAPEDRVNVFETVMKALPKFVYYSNYGNLDSEIYLPHVVENLRRQDLGTKEAAKARTLRVLFKFVRLKPEEILELGQDFRDPHDPARRPTEEEIAQITENKRERSILLQSAGSGLTTSFREWWKQGNYRFRFEADGNHFRIWVSDDRRTEEIELESRSTGLQWFLSFYLIFLVESDDAHRNSILLLDEPGLSLHPLAQRNLSQFFDGLAETNQILYTTHSPFLVDADRLDRARKVYVASDGTTKATENLRESAEETSQPGAAYAVHSALNMNIAESLLLGCQPVIVEGATDQHYLTTIKTLLIREGKITPRRELVFPPSGGTKMARIIASILTGRDETLPLVLLDSDVMGKRMAQEMRNGPYEQAPDRILTIEQFTGIDGTEVEDLFPTQFIAGIFDRWHRPDDNFLDFVQEDKPILGQIEAWVPNHGIILKQGWKIELAKRVKQQALNRGLNEFNSTTIDKWIALFTSLDRG